MELDLGRETRWICLQGKSRGSQQITLPARTGIRQSAGLDVDTAELVGGASPGRNQ
jgi:hypothetical protein